MNGKRLRILAIVACLCFFAAGAAACPAHSTAKGATPQQAPVNVSASVAAQSYSVALTWTASSSAGVTGYNVYRSTTSGSGYAKLTAQPVAADAFTDASVAQAATYFYVVTAVNSSGVESAFSNQATAVIP